MSKTITKVIRVDNTTKKLMCDFYKDMLSIGIEVGLHN